MYDRTPSREYCKMLGMELSEEDFSQFEKEAKARNFTQKNVDFVMQQHAWRVRCLFNPKSYSYLNRIKIALFFLNPFAKDYTKNVHK